MNNKNLTLKSLIQYLSLTAIIFSSLIFFNVSLANDIGQNLRSNTQEVNSSENYFEIGFMHVVRENDNKSNNPVLNGSYNWNGIFIESYSESGHGLAFGYNAFTNEQWSFDLVATTDWLKINYEETGRYSTDKNEFTLGMRLSGYLGDNIVQFAINRDARNIHNGITASALIGQNWQLRNWNFHGIIGAEYTSAKINNYYVGVSEESAARWDSLDAYEADDSVSFSTELGVTYPISEDWVFRATVRAATIPDELTDSPYFNNKDSVAKSFRTSLSYVF